MLNRTSLFVICCAIAYAAGNPAAGGEWRWKTRMPTVSPNVLAQPIEKLMQTFQPIVRIPGTEKVSSCGAVRGESRIVGGAEVAPHSFPWQVALYFSAGYFCGGSLVSSQWVITAAHCADGMAYVNVIAGAHNINQAELTQQSQISTQMYVHSGWNAYNLHNDISAIRLPKPFTMNNYVSPVCLPSYSAPELAVGTAVVASGWGLTSDGASSISVTLNSVAVTVAQHSICASVYGGTITESVICTSSTGGHGTCSGDSGGPLNYVSGGKTYTRGVTSFVSSAGCESGLPDGFTRVTSFLSWIETTTGVIIDA